MTHALFTFTKRKFLCFSLLFCITTIISVVRCTAQILPDPEFRIESLSNLLHAKNNLPTKDFDSLFPAKAWHFNSGLYHTWMKMGGLDFALNLSEALAFNQSISPYLDVGYNLTIGSSLYLPELQNVNSQAQQYLEAAKAINMGVVNYYYPLNP